MDKFISSFIGFVPAEKPVVAIAVMVDEPMVDHAGGNVAAPIFRRVAQMALKYRGMTPKGTDRADVAVLAKSPDPANATYALLREAAGKKPPIQEVVASNGPVPAGKVRVPDMTGWPARAVLKAALDLGVEPKISGTGLLVTQQPPPGQVMDKGATLSLVFEPAS
jgi:cell division protein FtsI (penicillin-binding protein 3)